MVLVFIADGLLWNGLGWALTAALAARAVWIARAHVHPSERVGAGADR
jgi:hypothetical protein